VTLFLPLLLQVVHQVSPVLINFLSIVISMGWTTATFTVSGWSGSRERLAPHRAGHRHDRARLPDGRGFAAGARANDREPIRDRDRYRRMQCAPGHPATEGVTFDEHHGTAFPLASVCLIGTAFGAAIAGVVANVAGLGDATEPGAVGHAVTAVYVFCCNRSGLRHC
jgi:hypothetical protein